MKPTLGPLALLALMSMPEPSHTTDMDRKISERVLAKLSKEAKGKPAYFDPATMTPWMEDYYYGRKLR